MFLIEWALFNIYKKQTFFLPGGWAPEQAKGRVEVAQQLEHDQVALNALTWK